MTEGLFQLPLPAADQVGIWPVPEVPTTLPQDISELELKFLHVLAARQIFRFIHAPEVGVMLVNEDISMIFKMKASIDDYEGAALALERWILQISDVDRRFLVALYVVRCWFHVAETNNGTVSHLLEQMPADARRRFKLQRHQRRTAEATRAVTQTSE